AGSGSASEMSAMTSNGVPTLASAARSWRSASGSSVASTFPRNISITLSLSGTARISTMCGAEADRGEAVGSIKDLEVDLTTSVDMSDGPDDGLGSGTLRRDRPPALHEPFPDAVHHRQEKQGERTGGKRPCDDHHRQRTLGLASDPVRERRRDEPQGCQAR